MKNQLSAEDIFSLSESFHDLFVALGKFMDSNQNVLTHAQHTDLEEMKWKLFNIASKLNAESVLLQVNLLDADLKILKSCTDNMQAAVQKITNVKNAIAIATKAITFGLAASSGNVPSMLAAAPSLIQEINT